MSKVSPQKLLALSSSRQRRGGAVDWEEAKHVRAEGGRFGAKPGAKEAKAAKLAASLARRAAEARAPKEEPTPQPRQAFVGDLAKMRTPDDYKPPERLDESDHKVMRTIASGHVVKSEPKPGGVNGGTVLTFEDAQGNQQKALFKPRDGEEALYRQIKNLYTREVAVAKAAPLFGVRGPVVTFRQVDGRIGSAQAWDHDVIGSVDLLGAGHKIDRASVEKLRAMDIVLGNTDRHAGNVMWRVNKGVATAVPIDNGYALPDKPVSSQSFARVLHRESAKDWAGGPLPETKKMLGAIDEKHLASTLLASGIPPNCAEQAILRLRALNANPRALEFHADGGRVDHHEADRDLGRAQTQYNEHVSAKDIKDVAAMVRVEATKAIAADENVKKLWNDRSTTFAAGGRHGPGHGPPGKSADIHEPGKTAPGPAAVADPVDAKPSPINVDRAKAQWNKQLVAAGQAPVFNVASKPRDVVDAAGGSSAVRRAMLGLPKKGAPKPPNQREQKIARHYGWLGPSEQRHVHNHIQHGEHLPEHVKVAAPALAKAGPTLIARALRKAGVRVPRRKKPKVAADPNRGAPWA